MTDSNFTGDRKAPMRSPLAALEKRFIQATVHHFPRWIEGYHLTLLTIPWSAGVIVAGWLAARVDPHWLWLSSAMLFLQWFTDSFDGALGRHRDFGIPKWGFYMDHMLDFVFMWCVPVSYAFVVEDPTSVVLLFVIAYLYVAMMAASFLEYAALGDFRITYFGVGPTEVRLGCIALNTALIYLGPGFLASALPWATGVFGVFLVAMVFRTQRRIWRIERP